MNDFVFKIGDFVRHAISDRQKSGSLRGQVQIRVADECTAGVQRCYYVRWVREDGAIMHDACMKHHEIELVLSEPFPEVRADDD